MFSLINPEVTKYISYAEYIEGRLYDKTNGYYMKEIPKIGKIGDYYTSVTMGSILAEVIADTFIHSVIKDNSAPIFCEVASGTGHFAKAFMDYVKKNFLSLYHEITYISVEKSPYHLKIQKGRLNGYPIEFYQELSEIDSFSGMIFSNEWFDALPVHVIRKNQGQLCEIMLQRMNRKFYEVEVPLTNKEIWEYLSCFPELHIQNGQRVEIPLMMIQQYKRLLEILEKGWLITIDYGYTFSELQQPERIDGTLRGYKNHKMIQNILEDQEDLDITHHIHFESLIETGNKYNVKTINFVRQDDFLIRQGVLNKLVESENLDPFSEVHKRNRVIRSLIDPGGISSYFHVLLQKK